MGKAGKYNKLAYKRRENVRRVTDFVRENRSFLKLSEIGRQYEIPSIQPKASGLCFFSSDEAQKLEDFFRALGKKIKDAGFMEEVADIAQETNVKQIAVAGKKLDYVPV